MINVRFKFLSLLIGLMFFSLSGISQENVSGELYDLAKVKNGVRNKRISSTDPTGGNNDRLENIKSGETRVFADIKGSGVINHIWITIAPGPADS